MGHYYQFAGTFKADVVRFYPVWGKIRLNYTAVCTAGGPATLTVVDAKDNSLPYTIPNGGQLQLDNVPTFSWTLSGNGATIAVDFTTPDEKVDPKTLLAQISGTIQTDFGQSNAPANIVTNTQSTASTVGNISANQLPSVLDGNTLRVGVENTGLGVSGRVLVQDQH